MPRQGGELQVLQERAARGAACHSRAKRLPVVPARWQVAEQRGFRCHSGEVGQQKRLAVLSREAHLYRRAVPLCQCWRRLDLQRHVEWLVALGHPRSRRS